MHGVWLLMPGRSITPSSSIAAKGFRLSSRYRINLIRIGDTTITNAAQQRHFTMPGGNIFMAELMQIIVATGACHYLHQAH